MRHRATVRRLALLVTTLVAAPVAAQHVDAVVPGDRIRFVERLAPDGDRIEGTVLVNTRDSLRLALRGGVREATFARSGITRVELATEIDTRRASLVRWTTLGALMGAVALVAGTTSNCWGNWAPSPEPGCASERSAGTVVRSAVAGAAVGAFGGALWGAVRPIQRWVPLVESRRVGFGVAPQGARGAALVVSLR